MLRYALASKFWRAVPTWWADRAWQRRSRQVSLQAARLVPAYAKLLHAFQPIPPQSPVQSTQMRECPHLQTSRASYVDVFPAEQRGRLGWQRQVVSFDRLDGQSGHTDSWPRSSDELHALREQLVDLLAIWFDTRQRRSLLLTSLPAAGWCAGRRIAQALHEAIAFGHLRASVVELPADPGPPDPAIHRLVSQFDQCVLLCQPQDSLRLARQLMETCGRIGVVAFGSISSADRAAMPPGATVCSAWGADEVGPLIALETPLTRMLGEACQSNPDLQQELLPEPRRVMGLYQPFPLGPSIEQDGCHLLVSSWGASPVIRYRLDPAGRLIRFTDICRLLQRFKLQSPRRLRRLTRIGSAYWKLPVVLLTGS